MAGGPRSQCVAVNREGNGSMQNGHDAVDRSLLGALVVEERRPSRRWRGGIAVLFVLVACGVGVKGDSGATEAVAAAGTPADPLGTGSTTAPDAAGKIVFNSDRSGTWELWAMEADGSGPQKLTGSPAGGLAAAAPDLSPDGTRIVWLQQLASHTAHVMTMGIDGTGVAQISNEPAFYGFPSWSPDGTRIAVSHRTGRVVTMRPDGTDVRAVFTDPDIPVLSVSWSPDGSQLVADTDNSNPHAKGLWLIDLDHASARRLFSGDAISPAWSPNGQWIAFASEGHLLKIRPDGTGMTPMISDPLPVDGQVVEWEPAWSRDGTHIAFVVTQVGSTNTDIWVMDADGTDPRNVSNTSASEGSPSFL